MTLINDEHTILQSPGKRRASSWAHKVSILRTCQRQQVSVRVIRNRLRKKPHAGNI